MATMLFLMHVRRSSKMAKVFPASSQAPRRGDMKGESRRASSGSIWIIRGAGERRFEGELSWPAQLRRGARLPPPTCPLKCIFVSLLLPSGCRHLRALHSRYDSKERVSPVGARCPHWTQATPRRETVTAQRWAAATRESPSIKRVLFRETSSTSIQLFAFACFGSAPKSRRALSAVPACQGPTTTPFI